MPRWLRITAWSLGGLLVLVLFGIATVVVIGNTGGGRRLLESETAKLTSGQVRIAGFGGSFPADIEIASLELQRPEGRLADGQGHFAALVALALLAWDMHVESLAIRAADVARRPVSSPANSREQQQLQLEHRPASTSIGCRSELSCSSRRQQAWRRASNVHGNLHYRSMKDAQGSLVARRTNGTGDYEVTLRTAASSGMSASLKLEEPAGGPLEHLLNFPGLGALSVLAERRRAAECGKAEPRCARRAVERQRRRNGRPRTAGGRSFLLGGFSGHVAQARARLAASRAAGTLERARDRASGHGRVGSRRARAARRLAARLSAGESRQRMATC